MMEIFHWSAFMRNRIAFIGLIVLGFYFLANPALGAQEITISQKGEKKMKLTEEWGKTFPKNDEGVKF